jgi:hypothetical protein
VLERTQIRTNKDGVWNTTIYIRLNTVNTVMERDMLVGMSKMPYIVADIANVKYSIGSFRNI